MVDPQILNRVTDEFMLHLQHTGTTIRATSQTIFIYIATIQLVMVSLRLVLIGESLQRLLVTFVQQSALLGFMYACITQGGEWIPQLLNGFVEIGKQGGVSSINPSSIIGQGVAISGQVFKAIGLMGALTHPFVEIIAAVVSVGLLVIYGLMGAELVLVLVKSYVLIALSSLFFAFGGSEFTRTMTVNYVRTVIGIGLQLMTIYLLLGIGQQIGNDWVKMTVDAARDQDITPMFVMLATAIVLYMLLKNIPPFIAQLSGVGGFRDHSEAAVGVAVFAGMTGANLTKSTVRGARKGAAAVSGFLRNQFQA